MSCVHALFCSLPQPHHPDQPRVFYRFSTRQIAVRTVSNRVKVVESNTVVWLHTACFAILRPHPPVRLPPFAFPCRLGFVGRVLRPSASLSGAHLQRERALRHFRKRRCHHWLLATGGEVNLDSHVYFCLPQVADFGSFRSC